MVSQREDLNTGWMTIGEWLSTHPPLAKRIAQLDPALATVVSAPARGRLRALAILAACLAPLVLAGAVAALLLPSWIARSRQQGESARYEAPPADVAFEQARREVAELAALIQTQRRAGCELPWDAVDLYGRWNAANPGRSEPHARTNHPILALSGD